MPLPGYNTIYDSPMIKAPGLPPMPVKTPQDLALEQENRRVNEHRFAPRGVAYTPEAYQAHLAEFLARAGAAPQPKVETPYTALMGKLVPQYNPIRFNSLLSP